jgi:splicing suppressor protein 51
VADTHTFDGAAVVKSEIFNGSSEPDPLLGFQLFLDKAQAKGSILPAWWDETKRAACEQLAVGDGEIGTEELRAWLDVRRRGALDKAAVIARYGDAQFPMQLRMLGEKVYGRGVGGNSGAGMLMMMASMEGGGGGGGGMAASVLDARTGGVSRVR